MPAVPIEIPGSDFSIHEYVWDRVWSGPAIVVGFSEETGRLAVAEIVQPAKLLGRVAHRDPLQVCRYIKLIVPEDEAHAVDEGLLWVVRNTSVAPVFSEPIDAFRTRLVDAARKRGIIE